jgi:hypothetical protein
MAALLAKTMHKITNKKKHAQEKPNQCKWHGKNGMGELDERQVLVDFFHGQCLQFSQIVT